jgi:hypothetical protein
MASVEHQAFDLTDQENDDFIKNRFEVVVRQHHSVQKYFILKVYSIVLLMLMLTAALVSVNIFVPVLKEFNQRYYYMTFIFLVPSLILLIALYIYSKTPYLNVILLTAFTCCMGWFLGIICARYTAFEVLMAAAITGVIMILLSGYVLITQVNLNWLGAGIVIALIGLMLTSLVTVLFAFVFHIGRVWLICLSGFGAVLMSLFILYDTSQMIHKYTPDEVIECAIALYLDVINLFQYVLILFRLSSD